ncbi:MAG: hypothetical protein LBF64_01800 [Oscillospiraceae bacterium]|jgi:hypothetical protein|nr:hypothetical protein [Oscillospiraceae bacterium]
MKRARSIFAKRLAFVASILMLIGFLPLIPEAAGYADPGAESALEIHLRAVKEATGVTATLKNPTSADIHANFIFAAYGSDGKLRYHRLYAVTIGADSSEVQRFDYDIAAHPDHIIKVFAWDQLSFAPLYKEITSARCITVDGSDIVYDGVSAVGDPEVTAFTFVMIDEMTRRGRAYTATKSGRRWTHTGAEDVDVVLAYRPSAYIGGALPTLEMSDLRAPNGNNRARVVISLSD